jgi:UDPglucose 6-dehydrogenase
MLRLARHTFAVLVSRNAVPGRFTSRNSVPGYNLHRILHEHRRRRNWLRWAGNWNLFCRTGNNVICVDNNKEKVKSLRAGKIPIFEPGLDVLFERNTKEGRLHFTTDLGEAVEKASIIFLALPTPPGDDGSADLSYIMGVAKDLSAIITDYKVIVDKSTVPVGTAEKVAAIMAEKLSKKMFDVVSNPEFLREGVAVDDFLKPDRVVVGTKSERARKAMRQLYEPFVRQGNPIYFMDERSAEMTKYAANSYLAARISFMNEIANLCEKVGANVDQVRIGMGSDTRIGKRFLFPGIGYGGSCFPKDVQALAKTASEYSYDFKILKSVMKVNGIQKGILTKKIKNTTKTIFRAKPSRSGDGFQTQHRRHPRSAGTCHHRRIAGHGGKNPRF